MTQISYRRLTLGYLPIVRINRTLGTILVPGVVTVSKMAHAHIAQDHPLEYADIMAALPGIIAAPTFIGLDPKHPHAFYLVDALQTVVGQYALVALGFVPSTGGTYQVKSAYGLKASQFAGRVRAGRVVPLL